MINTKNKKIFIIGGILFLLILIISIIYLVIGIFFKKEDPVELTNNYLEAYQKLDEKIISKISYDYNDKLTKKQKEFYKSIMKKQYENLKYEITKEEVNETDAVITVLINVYDYSSAIAKANNYIEVYSDKFQKNGKFDTYKAIDYKLEALNTYNERVDYSLNFYYYLDNGKWIMTDINEIDLKKINGSY